MAPGRWHPTWKQSANPASTALCGFGGAFSATEPALSAGIGLEKLKNIQNSGAEEILSGDMGCLMHLNGLIEKHKINLTTKHYAQVLAETID